MQWERDFSSNTMKNHHNTLLQRERDIFPATKPKDMDYCAITNNEFKIAVMNKFTELQENS